MSKYRYRENKIYCGDFLDVDIYPVFKKAGARKERYKPTSEMQARLNASRAKKKLERLLHTNFTSNDYALHLTYDNNCLPEGAEQAQKDVQNYLRRLRRFYKNNGLELKYVSVTEKGKKSGRIHHHIIINGGADRTQIEELWHKGYANSRKLRFTKNGLAGLSSYIVKQPLLFKRWTCSRNLKKPLERKNDYKYSTGKVRAIYEFKYTERDIEKLYPGYFVSEADPMYNAVNGGYYIQIRLYKKTARILN